PAFERLQPDPALVDAMRPRVDGPMPERFDRIAYWSAYTTHRDPVLAVYAGYEVPGAKDPDEQLYALGTIDPRDGRPLPDDQLKIGSGFFYPMHYSLTVDWKNLGFWIVGLAAMAMLAALVSGIVLHRRIFRELFTFRPGKARLRSVLDLHNLTGVVALPFHFFFAFTGLLIFASTYYFPVGHTQLHDLHELHEKHEAAALGLPHGRSGVPAGLANVDGRRAAWPVTSASWCCSTWATPMATSACTAPAPTASPWSGRASISRPIPASCCARTCRPRRPGAWRSSSPACTCSTSATGCCAG